VAIAAINLRAWPDDVAWASALAPYAEHAERSVSGAATGLWLPTRRSRQALGTCSKARRWLSRAYRVSIQVEHGRLPKGGIRRWTLLVDQPSADLQTHTHCPGTSSSRCTAAHSPASQVAAATSAMPYRARLTNSDGMTSLYDWLGQCVVADLGNLVKQGPRCTSGGRLAVGSIVEDQRAETVACSCLGFQAAARSPANAVRCTGQR
jgi:hypothetical protein